MNGPVKLTIATVLINSMVILIILCKGRQHNRRPSTYGDYGRPNNTEHRAFSLHERPSKLKFVVTCRLRDGLDTSRIHQLSTAAFRKAVQLVGGVVCCHLPNATELQPLRAGDVRR